MNTRPLMGTMLKSKFLSGHADVDFFEKLIKFGTLLKTCVKDCAPSSDYKKWKRNMLFELCSAHAKKVCIGWKNLPHYEKLRKEHPDFHNQFMALKKLFN